MPVIDDWVYAWSVEHLLATGRLEQLDYSANATYVQVLWGALFCLPAGFSFTALRLSTFVLSGAALAGVHRLLRDAEATRAGSLLGAAALAVYPPFVTLSFSFMTDVPFLALETWTLVWFARALRQHSVREVWIGTGLAALAAGVRYVGVIPAMAMAGALGADRSGWGRARGRSVVPLLALVALAGVTVYQSGHARHVADLTYIENSPVARMAALRAYGLALFPDMLRQCAEFVAVMSGLALAPVALALLPGTRSRPRAALAVAALAASVLAAGHVLGLRHYVPQDFPLGPGARINTDALGAVLTLLPGWDAPPPPSAVTWGAVAALWGAFVVIGASAIARGGRDAGRSLFWWSLAGMLGAGALLWLVADRYILPLLPVVLALALGRGASVSWRAATPLLLASALVAVAATRDREAAQRALWAAVQDLRARGIPAADIDAGYVVNGWLQYAHPEQAHRDAQGEVAVPWMNAGPALPWVIASRPLHDTTVVAEYPFARTFAPPGAVVLLRRTP